MTARDSSRATYSQTIITSASNPRIKFVRSLRRRAVREQSGLFFVEGVRAIAEAIQLGAGVQTLVVAPALLTSPLGYELIYQVSGADYLEVNADVFRSLSAQENPQGIGAIVRQKWVELGTAKANLGLCWVALESVQYPGNLGTVLRTSEAVGGAGVILLGNATDPYDPLCIRASMGAVFSQNLMRTTFPEFNAWCSREHCTLVGTSPSAATDYLAVAYPEPTVLLMGSEQHGLTAEHIAACHHLVRIPMVGRCDSLNLAVSTSTILYEIFNQRRAASPRG
jgi:TrmH family RNA methyltransferase